MSESNYRVPALARGLEIVQLFGPEKRVLSTHDFAEHLGVSNSSIYRIVQTLVDYCFLRKVARNTYELGPAVVSLGFSYLTSRDLTDIVAPHLNRLRDRTAISCHLGVRDGRDTLYIYRALASQRLSVNVPVGTRLPCHVNALGRALLGGLSDEMLGRLYFGVQLDDYPKPHPQNLPELHKHLVQERKRGYVISHSDYATAIAAPLYNHSSEVVAAINISGPDVVMKGAPVNQSIAQALLETAMLISKELGYSG